MADIFEEVEEQLRSDRYIAIAKRSWPFAAGAAGVALVLALGLWAWDQHQSSLQASASEAYNRGLDAVAAGDRAKAETEFGTVAKSGPRGYRTLALMQEGALRLADKKTAEAIALFDQVQAFDQAGANRTALLLLGFAFAVLAVTAWLRARDRAWA